MPKKTCFAILLFCLLILSGVRLAAQIGPVSFSPDSKSIAFSYSKSGTCFIYKAEVQGGAAKRITKATDGCEADPAFSKDGTLIAYSYIPQGSRHSNLYLVNADGSNSHLLLQAEADDMYPVFAPDGKTLYFMRSLFFGHYSPIVRSRHHDFDLFRIDLKSKQAEPITHDKFYEASAPSVSPDGKSVIFKGPGGPGRSELFRVYSVVGSADLQFALQPRVPGEPGAGPIPSDVCYLPNGTDIIFQAASNGSRYFNYDIYRMDLDGGHLENLTTGIGYAAGIRPSPDGKTAMFLKWNLDENTNQIYLLDLATHELRPMKLTGFEGR